MSTSKHEHNETTTPLRPWNSPLIRPTQSAKTSGLISAYNSKHPGTDSFELRDRQYALPVPLPIPLPLPPQECLPKSTPTLISLEQNGDFAMGAPGSIEGTVSTPVPADLKIRLRVGHPVMTVPRITLDNHNNAQIPVRLHTLIPLMDPACNTSAVPNVLTVMMVPSKASNFAYLRKYPEVRRFSHKTRPCSTLRPRCQRTRPVPLPTTNIAVTSPSKAFTSVADGWKER